MRIGILTLPLHTNYGGILQAYALQIVLERMGHEVVVFGRPKFLKLSLWKLPLLYSKRLLKKYILGEKEVRIFYEQWFNRAYPIISQHTQLFIDNYIHYLTLDSLDSLNPDDFDAIIVGSDQIWRPKYSSKIENAYLQFAVNWKIKRVAYAVSFGTDQWEYTSAKTEKCKKLVHKFDAISVRELSGVNLCQNYLGVKAQHVLDPTMLIDKMDYINIFETARTPKSPGDLLVYILDETPEKTELINNVSKEKGLIPFRVNSVSENHKIPLEKRIKPSLEKWLRGFYDAEFVVTDSFHACVFSIIFGKPFIVYGNENRGLSRFESLLKLFSLEDRLITNSNLKSFTDINWMEVEKKLHYLRKESSRFLEDNLV